MSRQGLSAESTTSTTRFRFSSSTARSTYAP